MLHIAREIKELGSSKCYEHKIEISAHKLEDWGERLEMLLTGNQGELEASRDDILNGNPAKYQ